MWSIDEDVYEKQLKSLIFHTTVLTAILLILKELFRIKVKGK